MNDAHESPATALPHPEELPPLSLRQSYSAIGQVLIVTAVLSAGVGGILYFLKTRKMPVAEDIARELPAIEVATVESGEFTPVILSQGIVEPIAQTAAKSEIAGKVTWVSPKWHAGENLAAGEVYLKVDPADYEAALAQAKAKEADAKVGLELAQAKADQAKRDWEKLNPGQQPANKLVLQEPQLMAARSALEAATAAAAKAQRDLDRTQFQMPYLGRIQKTYVHLGTYLAPGTPVADFFSTERYQIRLPISPEDAALLDTSNQSRISLRLPEQPEFTAQAAQAAHIAQTAHIAQFARTEGEIDRQTRSLVVVAEIVPTAADQAQVVPGQFFHASLAAKPLKGLLRLPRKCLREDAYIWQVSENQQLKQANLQIVRHEQNVVYFQSAPGPGPAPGTQVLASVLPVTTEGMKVAPVPKPPTKG